MGEQGSRWVPAEDVANLVRAIFSLDDEGMAELGRKVLGYEEGMPELGKVTDMTPEEYEAEVDRRVKEVRDRPPPVTPEEVQNYMDPNWLLSTGIKTICREDGIQGIATMLEKYAHVMMSVYGSQLKPADAGSDRTMGAQNPDQALQAGGPTSIQRGSNNPDSNKPGAGAANPEAAGTNPNAAGVAPHQVYLPHLHLPSFDTIRKDATPAVAGTSLAAAGTNPNAAGTKPGAASTNPAAAAAAAGTKPTAASANPAAATTNPAAAGTNPGAAITNLAAAGTSPNAAGTTPAAAAGTNPDAAVVNPAAAAATKPNAAGANPDAAIANPAAPVPNPAAASGPAQSQRGPVNPNTATEKDRATLTSEPNGPIQPSDLSLQGPGSPLTATSVSRAASKIEACARCGVTEDGLENGKLKRCCGCGTVRYCGKACQKADWPAHKATCKRLQASQG